MKKSDSTTWTGRSASDSYRTQCAPNSLSR